MIKVSDYIVDFLIEKGVTDVFGYPGGMVTHLMNSFYNRQEQIKAHVNYHEQASAFCACGYAQACGKVGIAYATSGPGATNLVTGICDAYFDSLPTLFITGQVNTFEAKGNMPVRQRGFQETDIVAITERITKYSVYVEKAEDIRYELEKAWHIANEGRKGPVLLDIPSNIQRSMIEPETLRKYISPKMVPGFRDDCEKIISLLEESKRPVLLFGAGIKSANATEAAQALVKKWKIPVVTSMLAFDIPDAAQENYGFIGAYGMRSANFIIAKADLIISVGSRLDVRQVGAKRENFAPDAKLVRIDIDAGELQYKVHEDEIDILGDATGILKTLYQYTIDPVKFLTWKKICNEIKEKLDNLDNRHPNEMILEFSKRVPEDRIITTDVGQNQVWIAQSFMVKRGQRVFFSGGHGAMGYSLPAAIGAYYAVRKPIICFCGDGGIQMNIQELQFVAREKLPIITVILNNNALGMIRHFQEMYFDGIYCQTTKQYGYTTPSFEKLAAAYGIPYIKITDRQDLDKFCYQEQEPQIIEILLDEPTYVFPKLEFGKPNQDQEPLLDRTLYDELMNL